MLPSNRKRKSCVPRKRETMSRRTRLAASDLVKLWVTFLAGTAGTATHSAGQFNQSLC
jgi:hypothetical protein